MEPCHYVCHQWSVTPLSHSWQSKGEYGVDVTKLARPLPLEYLIIELTTSTPVDPRPYLMGGKGPPFPVENRTGIGQLIQVVRACGFCDR